MGGKDSMKTVKLLLDKREIDSDVVLLLDEMHLQKEESYQGKVLLLKLFHFY